MNSTTPRSSLLRFSLREMLLFLAIVAIGCAALRYAGELWLMGISACVLLLFMTATVIACVDRGTRQAQAIGFALCVTIYGILFWSAPPPANSPQRHGELGPDTGSLPTTKVLKPLFDSIVKRSYFNGAGKEIGPPAPGFIIGFIREVPDRNQFMATGHLLWALLLGYLGSRVACWAYARRLGSQEP